jgi:hypothetical protein
MLGRKRQRIATVRRADTSDQALARWGDAMDRRSDLSLTRRAYAKRLLATASVGDLRLEQVFAAVPREHFLGQGPWRIGTEEGVYIRRRTMIRCISTLMAWSASHPTVD